MTSEEDWRAEVAPKEALVPVPVAAPAMAAASSEDEVGSGGTRAQKWPRV